MQPRNSDSPPESVDEKHVEIEQVEVGISEGGVVSGQKIPPPPKLSLKQQRRAYHKADLWIMPMVTLMYLASFLDRGMHYVQLKYARTSDLKT